MNLKPAKLALEKIISLYNAMSTDEKNISTIERDLMLNYIRQLYEVFLEGEVKTATKTEPSPAPKIKDNVVRQHTDPESEMPDVYGTREKNAVPQPVVSFEREVVKAPPPKIEKTEVVYTPPVYTSPVEIPKPVAKVEPYSVTNMSASVSALFDDLSNNELSDRLSNQPISDLTRGLGLNDKLLFQNALFNNSKSGFEEILKDLNAMSGFESARAFLADIAMRYAWDGSEEKKKIARDFIRFVKRRFA